MNFDQRPADAAVVKGMLDRIAFRGPDAQRHVVLGRAALAHCSLRTTPESAEECQPLVDSSRQVWLVMDGRIDNREELKAELLTAGYSPRDDSDAELALGSYLRWGEEAPARMVGDFALAIWDGKRQSLFCARDALGAKPLYYYRHPRFFAFASDPAALFAVPDSERRPSLEGMTHYLMGYFDDPAITEFQNVHKIRQAHSLTVNGEGDLRMRRYWDVDVDRVLRLKNPAEYQEAFREVFGKAVKAQSRSLGRIGVSFSGGLDSSSVFGMLQDLRRRGEIAPSLRAYCTVFDGEPYDERPYMLAFQEQWGADIRWHQSRTPRPLWDWEEAWRSDAQPIPSPVAWGAHQLYRLAAEDGIRVLLGGVGGDDFLDAPACAAADLLLQGHGLEAWRYLRAWSDFNQAKMTSAINSAVLMPLRARFLPRPLRKLARRLLPRKPLPWIREPHAGRAMAHYQGGAWYASARPLPPARNVAYNAVHSGHLSYALEFLDRMGAAAGGLEVRQPFCDRRVVEFAVSVPESELMRNGQPKALMRSALGERLPAAIRQRVDKANPMALIVQGMAEASGQIEQLLRDSVLEGMGLVNAAAARAGYRAYLNRYGDSLNDPKSDATMGNTLDNLYQLVSLEAWMRVF